MTSWKKFQTKLSKQKSLTVVPGSHRDKGGLVSKTTATIPTMFGLMTHPFKCTVGNVSFWPLHGLLSSQRADIAGWGVGPFL